MTIAQASLLDPPFVRPLAEAVGWVEGLLTGTLATLVATISVAAVGFLLLQGRLPARRGVLVIAGCFVVFGASTIADGLLVLGTDLASTDADVAAPPAVEVPVPTVPPPPPQPQVYDPYAGASVPIR